MKSQVGGHFTLPRTWLDPEPGIDLVEIRYRCAPLGEAPDWGAGEESLVLVPRGEEAPLTRTCAIELPCGFAGAPSYALHYYFLVIQYGRQRTLPPASEQIVSREVAYRDEHGRYSALAVQWSIGDGSGANYTPLAAERLAASAVIGPRTPCPPPLMAEAGPIVALPRVFKGCVWGPRGATVYHVFHLQPVDAASAGGKTWDTNGGLLWQAVL